MAVASGLRAERRIRRRRGFGQGSIGAGACGFGEETRPKRLGGGRRSAVELRSGKRSGDTVPIARGRCAVQSNGNLSRMPPSLLDRRSPRWHAG